VSNFTYGASDFVTNGMAFMTTSGSSFLLSVGGIVVAASLMYWFVVLVVRVFRSVQ